MKWPSLPHTFITFISVCWPATISSSKRVMFMPAPSTSHAIAHMTLAHAVADLGHEVALVLSSHSVDRLGLRTVGTRVPHTQMGGDCSEVKTCPVSPTAPSTQLSGGRGWAKWAGTERLRVIEYSAICFEDDVVYPGIVQPLLEGKKPNQDFLAQTLLKMNGDILRNKTLFEEMKAFGPDLFVFDDDSSGAKMFTIFPYKMQVPFAAMDFVFDPKTKRVPFSPAATPSFLLPFQPDMNFKERMMNTLLTFFSGVHDPHCKNDAVARYAPEMPYVSVYDLVARAEIWLVQSDHMLDYPKPTLPNVKMVGYLAASPGEALPGDFQNFMDEAEDGVVIMSFGSRIHSLPDKWGKEVFMEAFKNLGKLKVVFRSNLTSPDLERIMTSQWIPQNDLLAHHNTRVFVTHCGMGGQYQALYHAVPMVGIPLSYDQPYNAERLMARGFGRVLQFSQLTASQLVEAIQDVATNPRYRQNIQRASALYREQYGESAKTAAYWLDHVMQYGGDYMRSAGQRMALYQFLLLDVIAAMVAILIILLLVSCCLLHFLYKVLRTKKRKTD